LHERVVRIRSFLLILSTSTMINLRALALGVTCATGATLVAACETKAPVKAGRPPVSVAVAKVRRSSVPYLIESNGVVTPLQSATVAAQVDGIVTEVAFQEGQDVSKGQLLFRIDSRPYQNAYQQTLAAVSRDKASVELAKGQFERYDKLVASGVVTSEQAETFRATYSSATAVLQSDSAALATARFNLDNTSVRAPVSGRTGGLLVRAGNLVRAGGSTPMVVINQIQPIMVRFAVPATELRRILKYGGTGGLVVKAGVGASAEGAAADSGARGDASGRATQVAVGGGRAGRGGGRRGEGAAGAESGGALGGNMGSRGSASRGAGEGVQSAGRGAAGGAGRGAGRGTGRGAAAAAVDDEQTAIGTLTFIDNAIDTTTGTVQLKATFPNRNGVLWVGQFVPVSLQLYVEENVLVVPAQAVVTGQRGAYVYVIDSAGVAQQKTVVVERTMRGLSIVSSGVMDGDQVVTDGQSRLNPGAKVEVRAANDTSSGGARRGGRGARGGTGAPGTDSSAKGGTGTPTPGTPAPSAGRGRPE